MVLAAGLGLRMRPLTNLRAKPVLPVLNRPLLHWTLESLARQGVTDVVVNLHHLPHTVRRAVGDGSAFGLRVRYSLERVILGTAGGPRKVRALLGDEPVLLVNGDVLFDFDLARLVERHRSSGARATLGLRPNPNPRHYGPVVTDSRGWVRSLPDLRRKPGVLSLFTGVHVLDPALLDRLRPGPSDSVRDLYAPLVQAGERILGVRLRGAWYDLGDPQAYRKSQIALLGSRFAGTGPSLVDSSARISREALVERSVVGAKAVVEDGASVVRSVLWDGAFVGQGARVIDSVVATRVEARREVREGVIATGVRAKRSSGARFQRENA